MQNGHFTLCMVCMMNSARVADPIHLKNHFGAIGNWKMFKWITNFKLWKFPPKLSEFAKCHEMRNDAMQCQIMKL